MSTPNGSIKVENKVETKEKWGNKFQYLFTLIGYSVGLGNVWRFPALAYKNGGGAFLIPYFSMYILVALPLYFLELGIGQFTAKCAPRSIEMAPLFKGIGWCMTFMSLAYSLYYNVIIAWVIHYLIASFRVKLNWGNCNNIWNDDTCITRETPLGVPTQSLKNNISIQYCNKSGVASVFNCTKGVYATAQYLDNYVLQLSDSINDFGTPKWALSLCLLLTWTLVAISLIFGIKSSGKVVYFTATFPYIVIIILLVYGLTLEGSGSGVLYYVKPNFDKVWSIDAWYLAASQVIFSMGICCGTLITFSGYNIPYNNIFNDAFAIVCADFFTSIFGGFAIFTYLGYMSYASKVPIDQLVESGSSLAFIIYPEAFSNMKGGQIFSILFFFMLLTLGLDSQFGTVEVVLTTLNEYLRIPKRFRWIMVLLACYSMFLIGLSFCCPGGFYLFEILNIYSGSQSTMIIGIVQCFIVVYIYGFNNFMQDIKLMVGKRILDFYWFVSWSLITPIILIVIIVIDASSSAIPVIKGRLLPLWAVYLGWGIVAFILLPLPVFAIIEIIKAFKNRKHIKNPNMPLYLAILKHTIKPSKQWKPGRKEYQIGRYDTSSKNMNLKETTFNDNIAFEDIENYRL